jgi:DNA polymerase type B, organellar and viral
MMSKRYPHYLYTARGGRWPTEVVIVGVTGAFTEERPGSRVRGEVLLGWHARCLRKREGVYGLVCTWSGRTVSGFWETLSRHVRHGGTVWVISHHCPRVWALLGLWAQLEGGEWYVHRRRSRLPSLENLPMRGLRPDSDGTDTVPAPTTLSPMPQYQSGLLVLEDPPCIIRMHRAGRPGSVCWVDTRNYAVAVPEALGPGPDAVSYCASWFLNFHQAAQDYHLGSLQATAGSQAMHAFLYNYKKGMVYVHNQRQSLELEGRSYYGGRCEVFRFGSGDSALWHLDFRSQYAAVGATQFVPVRLCDYLSYPGGSEASRLSRQGAVIADVTVQTPEPAYPLRRGREVIFPTGRFRTTLAGPELNDALERDRIVQWHALATYEAEPALTEYMRAVYRLRCQAEALSDKALAATAKQLLVSLVGKFGQRSWYWEPVWIDYVQAPYCEWHGRNEKGEIVRYRSVAWNTEREVPGGFAPNAVVSVAAWITSEARRVLLTAIRVAGWEHVHYVDTDALIVDRIGLGRLQLDGWVRPGQLGKLSVKSGPCKVEIRGIKYYVVDGQVTCAGLPKGVCTDAGDGRHYWYRQSPAAAVRSGQQPAATTTLGTYQRAPAYRHGVVGDDGKVTPFHLEA